MEKINKIFLHVGIMLGISIILSACNQAGNVGVSGSSKNAAVQANQKTYNPNFTMLESTESLAGPTLVSSHMVAETESTFTLAFPENTDLNTVAANTNVKLYAINKENANQALNLLNNNSNTNVTFIPFGVLVPLVVLTIVEVGHAIYVTYTYDPINDNDYGRAKLINADNSKTINGDNEKNLLTELITVGSQPSGGLVLATSHDHAGATAPLVVKMAEINEKFYRGINYGPYITLTQKTTEDSAPINVEFTINPLKGLTERTLTINHDTFVPGATVNLTITDAPVTGNNIVSLAATDGEINVESLTATMISPYESTNVSLNNEIIFEFSQPVESAAITVVTESGDGIEMTGTTTTSSDRHRVRFDLSPGTQYPVATRLRASVMASAAGRTITSETEMITLNRNIDDPLIIYEATNRDQGYSGELRNNSRLSISKILDNKCTSDENKPDDQIPPLANGEQRPPRIFKALFGVAEKLDDEDRVNSQSPDDNDQRFPCTNDGCGEGNSINWVLAPNKAYYKIIYNNKTSYSTGTYNGYELIDSTNEARIFTLPLLNSIRSDYYLTYPNAWTGLNSNWIAARTRMHACINWHIGNYYPEMFGYGGDLINMSSPSHGGLELPCNTRASVICVQQ